MNIACPYVDEWNELTAFSYLGPLSLIRPPAALLERLGPDGDYILQHDYDVALRIDGRSTIITVPRGLITDLTSVPWFLRWYVGRVGPWLEAAIVHDWLYVAWQVVGVAPTETQRRFADEVMRVAMEAAGIGAIRRAAIYSAVRLFGRRAFFRPDDRLFADLDARVFDTPLVLPDQRGGTGS